jgi:hypothetical protein
MLDAAAVVFRERILLGPCQEMQRGAGVVERGLASSENYRWTHRVAVLECVAGCAMTPGRSRAPRVFCGDSQGGADMKKRLSFGFLVGAVFAASNAWGNVIVDNSPDALGAAQQGNFSNVGTQQNFLVEFSLAVATQLTGMAIYSNFLDTTGEAVTIKIRNDNGGVPAATNLYDFADVISGVDKVGTSIDTNMSRVQTDFITPITLGPGVYWIGMSGAGEEIGWSSVTPPESLASQWQLIGDTLDFIPGVGRLAYQIDRGSPWPGRRRRISRPARPLAAGCSRGGGGDGRQPDRDRSIHKTDKGRANSPALFICAITRPLCPSRVMT